MTRHLLFLIDKLLLFVNFVTYVWMKQNVAICVKYRMTFGTKIFLSGCLYCRINYRLLISYNLKLIKLLKLAKPKTVLVCFLKWQFVIISLISEMSLRWNALHGVKKLLYFS